MRGHAGERRNLPGAIKLRSYPADVKTLSQTRVPPVSASSRGSLGIDHSLRIIDFTWPIVVAGASNHKARIRAQKEPIVSPAGTGNE